MRRPQAGRVYRLRVCRGLGPDESTDCGCEKASGRASLPTAGIRRPRAGRVYRLRV
ncbi:hypothetical protein LSAT2_007042 [Lamellibrachia satsuma]|nr:hypothetical protein LSAT2_007042 [Lamellibrachia satsuma]